MCYICSGLYINIQEAMVCMEYRISCNLNVKYVSIHFKYMGLNEVDNKVYSEICLEHIYSR